MKFVKENVLAGFATALLCACARPVLCLDNGLALKPPLGWSSWLALGERDYCDEKTLRDSADALVSTGLAETGYNTLMISDCWGATERDADGNLQAEKDRFPSGSLKSVIEYIHSKGLKAGVYQDIGNHTCVGGRVGMYGHYDQDAHFLATEWQIDWIKVRNVTGNISRTFGI